MSAFRWPFRHTVTTLLASCAIGVALWTQAWQGLPLAHSDPSDHELARQALQQGKVLPLRTVLDQVEREFKGQVVKVEFEHEDGRFIYELRVLHANGQLSKIEIDAVNGQVLRVRKKERD